MVPNAETSGNESRFFDWRLCRNFSPVIRNHFKRAFVFSTITRTWLMSMFQAEMYGGCSCSRWVRLMPWYPRIGKNCAPFAGFGRNENPASARTPNFWVYIARRNQILILDLMKKKIKIPRRSGLSLSICWSIGRPASDTQRTCPVRTWTTVKKLKLFCFFFCGVR